jgi:hypothetical protein
MLAQQLFLVDCTARLSFMVQSAPSIDSKICETWDFFFKKKVKEIH